MEKGDGRKTVKTAGAVVSIMHRRRTALIITQTGVTALTVGTTGRDYQRPKLDVRSMRRTAALLGKKVES